MSDQARTIESLAGKMIVFEGIDQAGKATLSRWFARQVMAAGVKVLLIGFPDYETEIGREIAESLAGRRDYPSKMRQLLMAANRWEWQADIATALEKRHAVIVDRYIGSGLTYSITQGFDSTWAQALEKGLREADMTVLLDIDAATSLERKPSGRDELEQKAWLLNRARAAYLRIADLSPSWHVVNAMAPREMVQARVWDALGLPGRSVIEAAS